MSSRYYCPGCGLEMTTHFWGVYSLLCPAHSCGGTLIEIPALEPLADWEKRTGEKCPDTMPVWMRTRLIQIGPPKWHEWRLSTYADAKEYMSIKGLRVQIIIANGPNEPGN